MLKDNRNRFLALILLLTVCIWTYAFIPSGRTLDVTVMDVGEGLCIVMRSPSGKTMVMDCGTCSWKNNDNVGESVVLPYLRSMGVREIDAAIISHPHEDHISGFESLLRNCPAKLVLATSATNQTPTYLALLRKIKKSGATYRVAKRGQTITLGDGVTIQVLSPASDDNNENLNEESIVLRVVYGETAFILTGDAGYTAEDEILNSDIPVTAQILQVGHHGSQDASSSKWLDAVQPRVAVISCGRNNIYGHPSEETLQRLQDSGALICRTDKNGAVSFHSNGKEIKVDVMVAH